MLFLKRRTANTPFEEKYNGIFPQDKAEKMSILWYADFREKIALNVPTDNFHFPQLQASFGCTYKSGRDDLSTAAQPIGCILHLNMTFTGSTSDLIEHLVG
jgi:hypothetical protein